MAKLTPTSQVTMREIAEQADVSIGTVSHVVNGTAVVRPKLKLRVLKAIRNLGFQPSALAQGMRRNRIRMLGIIVPDITNPFFPAVVRGAEDVAFNESYRVILCNTDNKPAKEALYVAELRSFRASGLLIIPAAGSDIVSELSPDPSGIQRVVCIDRCPAGWTGDAVVALNETGAYQATKYLIQSGHRNLALITGPSLLANSVERLNGFRKALSEARIAVSPEFIQEAAFDSRSGYEAGTRLLRMLPRPTAILACNDMMALGVLRALHERGLRCPEDVSLVGFDNLEFCEYTSPALTSVYQPGYQMGAAAARLLIERINGLQDPPKRIVLETELKVRNSVLPIASAADFPSQSVRPSKRKAKPVLAG
ncbi:MAG TPA: LacI family DNA-binding transcriptional regulator [Candidatus Aquilonibacter sp.]|nr:LacI family DNA-binding transcriptional regulator [Candidatus Aquilonibacter sp.]